MSCVVTELRRGRRLRRKMFAAGYFLNAAFNLVVAIVVILAANPLFPFLSVWYQECGGEKKLLHKAAALLASPLQACICRDAASTLQQEEETHISPHSYLDLQEAGQLQTVLERSSITLPFLVLPIVWLAAVGAQSLVYRSWYIAPSMHIALSQCVLWIPDTASLLAVWASHQLANDCGAAHYNQPGSFSIHRAVARPLAAALCRVSDGTTKPARPGQPAPWGCMHSMYRAQADVEGWSAATGTRACSLAARCLLFTCGARGT